jgi:hypothetical protein
VDAGVARGVVGDAGDDCFFSDGGGGGGMAFLSSSSLVLVAPFVSLLSFSPSCPSLSLSRSMRGGFFAAWIEGRLNHSIQGR